MAALHEWNSIGIRDSALAARGFTAPPQPALSTIGPRSRAEMTFFEGSPDSLWLAARALSPGQFTPVVRLPRSYAVGLLLEREEARPFTFGEAWGSVVRDERADRENTWVERELERLRAATPVRVVPSRLQAAKLNVGHTSDRSGG